MASVCCWVRSRVLNWNPPPSKSVGATWWDRSRSTVMMSTQRSARHPASRTGRAKPPFSASADTSTCTRPSTYAEAVTAPDPPFGLVVSLVVSVVEVDDDDVLPDVPERVVVDVVVDEPAFDPFW